MNDKKEPFNAVGDPFFKQVGEEHVEVAEEGNGCWWGGSGSGDSALGSSRAIVSVLYPAESRGRDGDVVVGERWRRSMLQCRSCNAATTLQCCNGGAAGLLKSK